jgi:hypothetical protein
MGETHAGTKAQYINDLAILHPGQAHRLVVFSAKRMNRTDAADWFEMTVNWQSICDH